jgi:hypothetical protein
MRYVEYDEEGNPLIRIQNPAAGHGLIVVSGKPWWNRLWVLVSNPFLYLFKGEGRW